jgi:hypothetical protein
VKGRGGVGTHLEVRDVQWERVDGAIPDGVCLNQEHAIGCSARSCDPSSDAQTEDVDKAMRV